LEATVGEYVYDDAYLTVNSVDFSDHLRSSQVNGTGDTLDKTAMGQTARTFLIGLLNATLGLELNDDMAAGSVDAILYAAWKARVAIPIAWRPFNTAISTANPELQFDVLVNQYNVGGGIGALAIKNLTWQVDGDITRDTTP
jgi:hypothetical protein